MASPKPIRASLAIGLIFLATIAASFSSAHAQIKEKEVTFGVTFSEAYSDNIDLDPDGEEQDALVSQVIPRVSIRKTGANNSLVFDGSVGIAHQTAGDDKGFQLIPESAGFGNFELSENLLFLDLSSAVSKELLNSEQADSESNRETVVSVTASPYLTNRLGAYADSELRYKFSQVIVDEGTYSDDMTHAGRWKLDGSTAFTALRWGTLAQISHTDRSDDHNITRSDVLADLEYAISPMFSVYGGGGYQTFDDGQDENEVDDPTWLAGVRLRSARGELSVDYGQRDGDESWRADLKYKIGAFTTVQAGYSEVLETGQERTLQDLSFIGEDEDTGVIIDTRTGEEFDLNSGLTSVSNQTTKTKRARAGITHNRERTRISLRATHEELVDQVGPDDEKIIAVDLFWERRLTRRVRLALGGHYKRSEFDDDGQKDDEYSVDTRLSYSLRDNLSAFGSYLFRTQDSNDPTAEFDENRFSVGLNFDF